MCLITPKVLKDYFVRRNVLKTLAIFDKQNVVGMINLLENQCRWRETFQIFNSIP